MPCELLLPKAVDPKYGANLARLIKVPCEKSTRGVVRQVRNLRQWPEVPGNHVCEDGFRIGPQLLVGLRKAFLNISPTGLCFTADVTERIGDFRVSRMNLRGIRLHGFDWIEDRREGIIFDSDQT